MIIYYLQYVFSVLRIKIRFGFTWDEIFSRKLPTNPQHVLKYVGIHFYILLLFIFYDLSLLF